MTFKQLLKALEAAHEGALDEKYEALATAGTLYENNVKLSAMLELCIEAMSFKTSLHPSGAFVVSTDIYQKIKGTREEAAALLANLSPE